MERKGLSRREFVALVAALMAIEALALDIMLPALPEIGAAFQVSDPNDRSLVLTVFLIGFGLPQVLFGPLSDRFGRRPPILIGLAIYMGCALSSPAMGNFAALLSLRLMASLCLFGACVLACFLVAEKGRLFGDGSVSTAPALDA